MKWFKKIQSIFKKTKENNKENMQKFLIVGLGNIGSQYENTRHNIGFKILDHFAHKNNITFESNKLGTIAQYKFKGRMFYLLKPSTFMNLSGKAVKYWLTKENIPIENLMVICDDINLPFGTIRIKTGGSDGGHNGLKSVYEILQTQQYNRFRFGIGAEFSEGRQSDYVLGEWTEDELKLLNERFDKSIQVITSFGTAGINNTMNTFNGK
jgi:PTH1 family peptidyl-tRNA hydrolase